MSNHTFPEGTRFCCKDDLFIVAIGGLLSGGAIVTFRHGQRGEITDEEFLKISPDELAEAAFREMAGVGVVDAWLASNPKEITDYLTGRESLGELAEFESD